MASRKQIEANRRNAWKSTGPRTAAGRAVSSRNALRHGLTAFQIIIPGESAAEFNAFYQERYESLAPVDPVGEGMVERIITCEWRLRRVYRVEAMVMNAIRPYDTNYSYILKQMAELSRYETAMDRALQRARYDFERHQARGRGEDVAAPIAITVSGTLDVEDQPRPPQESPREPVEGRNPPSPVPESGDSCRAGSDLMDGPLVSDGPPSD
jgi:hypothetical protein